MRTEPDVDQLLSLVGDFYESALDPDVTPRALRSLAACLNGGAAQIYTWHRPTGQVIDSRVSEELQAKDNEAFVEYYARIDPRRDAVMRKPPGTVVRCHELFDEKFVSGNEYYQDFFLPAGLRWCIGVHLDGGDGTSTLVANFRARGTPAFEDWTARTLGRLVPHIQRANYLRARIERATAGSMDAEDVLRALPIGALMLDRAGHMLVSNEASSEVLSDIGARFVRGVLHLTRPAANAAWREACERVARSRVARTVELPGASVGLWKAHVLPCNVLSRTHDASERGLLLVVFELVARAMKVRLADLRLRYRLTEAETEVLAMLLQGIAPKQIAARRGASVATVRSQMSALFGKTSCRSQRELVAALGAL